MIIVEWWQLGVIGIAVFVAVLIADQISSRLDAARERIAEAAYDATHGPFPCHTHMGTDPDGMEWWCVLKYGHDGQHVTPWGLEQSELDEWPEDDDVLAAAARKALADLDHGAVDMDAVTDAGGHVYEERDAAVDLFPPDIGTHEYPDLTLDPFSEPQCDSRNLGGQGHRCLYPAAHEGPHHFGVWPTGEPERCGALSNPGFGLQCILDAEHSIDHVYED